jgi:antitoxin component YwqK of YwqJK toxin-antitoxin module
MKFILICCCLLSLTVVGQPLSGMVKKDTCYKKSMARKGQRFTEWECGKLAGVVDCNEKLELDPGTNTVVTAGNKKPFSGQCETCHMNGILERRVTFVLGKTNGIDTTTYPSGCPMVIRSHIQGVENGKWTYFADSTAMPLWEKNYVMGQLDGPQVTYAYRNNKLDTTKFENYTNGVLNGQKVSYYKGKRSKQVNYVNGLLDGPFLLYNQDGIIIEETYYKEGKKNGVWKYYYEDGKLLRTENWNMDAKSGEFKTLYYDQSIQSIENYKKSNGKSVEYLTTQTYECSSKAIAYEVGKMLSDKKTQAQILEAIGNKEKISVFDDKLILQDQKPYLKGQKLGKGVNKPFELRKLYYVVWVQDVSVVTKNEIKEGWFEERFPDGKLKRRAHYEKDVLIEEHVYDEQGREIKSFGGTASTGKEDDAMPTTKSKKKKKRKKDEAKPAGQE